MEKNNVRLSQSTLEYIKNVNSMKKSMNKKEEYQLVKAAQRGDINSRNILIESNLYIVVNVVSHFFEYNIPVDDFIQMGNQKLIKCISEFDIEKNHRLTTFVSLCVYRDMLNKFNEINHGATMPAKEKLTFNILTQYYKYINKFGFEPTNEELAQLLNIEKEKIDYVFNCSRIPENYGLYEKSITPDKTNNYIVDFEQNLFNEEFIELFKIYVEKLEPRRCFTIKYHLGLIDGVEHTFREIGQILGITHQGAQEKYNLGMKELFLKLNKKHPEYYNELSKDRVKYKRKCK